MAEQLTRISPVELLRKYQEGERDFRRTKLRGNYRVTLQGEILEDVQTSGSDWRDVDLYNADLRNSVNKGTDFSGANLDCADFSDTDNRNAIFDRADLYGCDFFGADNRGAYFRWAKNIVDASWDDTAINGMHVDKLSWDDIQKLISDSVDLSKMPASLRRRIYSIDFHYIGGTQEKKEEYVHWAVDNLGCPITNVNVDLVPFYRVRATLWNDHREFVKPAEKVTKKDIEDVKAKLIKFAKLVRN